MLTSILLSLAARIDRHRLSCILVFLRHHISSHQRAKLVAIHRFLKTNQKRRSYCETSKTISDGWIAIIAYNDSHGPPTSCSIETQSSDYSSEFDDDYDSESEDGETPRPEAVILPTGPQAALLATFIRQMPPSDADMVHEDVDDSDGASPMDQWMAYMADIRNGKSKILRIQDEPMEWVFASHEGRDNNNGGDGAAPPSSAAAVFAQIADAIVASPGLTHVIWGKRVWQLGSPPQQHSVLQALARHAPTLTYWKMGTEERGLPLGSPAMTAALLDTWNSAELRLTGIELRGIVLASTQQVDMLASLLRRMGTTLKQVNLLGFFLHPKLLEQSQVPLFDGLLTGISDACRSLDELRLGRCVTRDSLDIPPLISPEALEILLSRKTKWWRLGLDGLGLDDRHIHVLSIALKSSSSCKMGDLLSLKENPKLRDYGTLVNICSCKARMGSVQVDDPKWVATFDLVRSLNNLHRRLDYVNPEIGGYPNRSKWVEWLSVVANLQWEDDTHIVNYLWYTLMEKPEFIQPICRTTN
eukprot:scaffold22689_cov163-Cylindrotheca_fusiformis.AAC.6